MLPLHDDIATQRRPVLTVSFMVLCVAVFLWQVGLSARDQQLLAYSFGVVPAVLIGGHALPASMTLVPVELNLISYMFLHGGWMHLIGNMLFLWIFGNNVEDHLGHGRFVAFYFVCGIVAALAHALPNAASPVPMIGASGAISGVLGAYLLLFPRARVLVAIPLGFYFHVTRLPAVWVLGLWFVLQLISSLAAKPGEAGVAWYAHIGGFLAGMALLPLFNLTRPRSH